jgi:septal ring factor EnvC (AmiA/AmiB activator)
MMRTWKMFGLQTLLAAILSATPALATAGTENENADIKDIKQRLETIEKGLTAIQKSIDAIKAQALNVNLMNARLNKLEEKMAGLQTTLEALQKQLKKQNTTQVSKAPPEVGKIVLTNRYDEEILFIVNNTSYRLAPGTSSVLAEVPAGTITYEVISPTFGLVTRKTTTLAANKTININVD